MSDPYIESNRELWNVWAELHAESEFYDVESFKRGQFRLHPVEVEEVGDVRGKTLLHLQCHFGMDTLSWASGGAIVTGVDFSDKAIELARRLADEMHMSATFVCSNIYDLPEALEGQFDVVFTSHGVLNWLPDMARWGQVVAHFLKPGGTFYVTDAHPLAQVFDLDHPSDLVTRYPYFLKDPLRFEVDGSYAVAHPNYKGVEYGWNHTLADIINALIDAGLRIEFLHEFPFLTWRAFPFMERDEQRYWRLTGSHTDMIPLMFSIKATK